MKKHLNKNKEKPCKICGDDKVIAISKDEQDPKLKLLWEEANQVDPSVDGWQVMPCPVCNL